MLHVNHLHTTTGIHPLVNKKTIIETLIQVKNLHLKRIDRYMLVPFILGKTCQPAIANRKKYKWL